VSRRCLDWNDATEVKLWLAGLWSAFEDADAIALDMLKPARARQLGPALHAQKYAETREQILHALAYAAPEPEPENGEPGDGDGSAGGVH
jgi:hypothetical protein